MSLVILLFGGLITWRLATMIGRETGPAAVFARFRAYLAQKQKRHGGFYDMLSCMGCLSIYVAAVTAIAPAGDVLEWLGYTLSFSAVSMLIEAIFKRQV